MARNSGGTYSLPAGNPVVTGTTISSSVNNATDSDIATELTDSLCRSGKGAMLAPLPLANGTVSLPALTFDTDADSGLYRIGANNIGVAVNGAKVVDVGTTGASIVGTTTTSGQTLASDGTKTAPGVGFTSDVDSGLYRIGANNPAMSAGDTKVQDWTTAGTTVTGTATVSGLLTASAAATVTGLLTANGAITAAKTSGDVITATATTSGKGVVATGAGASIGVQGTGGATSGTGVAGTGGAGNGVGGIFTGGTTDGTGLTAAGTGTGAGASISTSGGTGYGLIVQGNSTRAPLRVVSLAAAPSSPQDGDVYYDSVLVKLRVRAGGAWVDLH